MPNRLLLVFWCFVWLLKEWKFLEVKIAGVRSEQRTIKKGRYFYDEKEEAFQNNLLRRKFGSPSGRMVSK